MPQLTRLREDVLKTGAAHLEKLIQISPKETKGLEFIDVGLLCITYDVAMKTSPHYLLKNDQWVEILRCVHVATRTTAKKSVFSTATHYALGPQTKIIIPSEVKNHLYTDHVPIAYFKRPNA